MLYQIISWPFIFHATVNFLSFYKMVQASAIIVSISFFSFKSIMFSVNKMMALKVFFQFSISTYHSLPPSISGIHALFRFSLSLYTENQTFIVHYLNWSTHTCPRGEQKEGTRYWIIQFTHTYNGKGRMKAHEIENITVDGTKGYQRRDMLSPSWFMW